MKKYITLILLAITITGCTGSKHAQIVSSKPAAKVVTASRSEPIFYNGKNYQLNYSYNVSQGAFDMKVAGLGAKQQKDAVNIATSSLAYYACPNGQRGKLINSPIYVDGRWALQAKCG